MKIDITTPAVFLLLTLSTLLHAEEQPPPVDSTVAPADSLQIQADSLEQRAMELERQLEAIDTTASGQDSGIGPEITRIKNEMVLIKDKIAASVKSSVNSALTAALGNAEAGEKKKIADPPEKIHVVIEHPNVAPKKKKRKGSGAFMLSFEFSDYDVAPLEHLSKHDRSLSGIPISFSDNRMLMIGFTGYYSDNRNVRLGNGLYFGYKAFDSEIYTRPLATSPSDSLVDSIVTLRAIPVYYGFLCEKAFRYEQVDFFAGLMLGGHVSVIVKEEQSAALVSSFISDKTYENSEDPNYSVALSPAVYGDLHGGISFALSERMHIGLDGILRCIYAYEGFGPGFGDYFSVSPGIRMRLAFGKAG